MFRRFTLLLALVAGSGGICQAQSFNIDLNENLGGPETGAGPPSDAFGAAAGQAGRWNAIPASSGAPHSLTGLDGMLTSVVLDADGGTGSSGGYNNPAFTGDFRFLMADYVWLGLPIQYHFSGLQPGHYRILTYGGNASGDVVQEFINVPGATTPEQTITGPVPANEFILGIDYSVHDLDLVGSSFEIDATMTGYPPAAQIHGFQLVYSPVPEPATLSAAVAAGVLFTLRRRTHVS